MMGRKNILTIIIFLITTVSLNAIKEVTNKNELNEVLKSHEKVVAEFFSPTCPHCISFNKSGIFESLEKENPGIAFIKINFNEAKSLFDQFSVRSFPTFIVFKSGAAAQTQVGGATKTNLKKLISQ